ncbi:hypothetical protein FB567DRAFT_318310 [Paraphoma chrysanthemicola]|uniref:Uncharacterized protein n=1 Tax=Paraphoma chrysanthemicola TaxID=798071 RepID=A0A8K0R9Y3_9PLEO|nr:hypothetical protein FB567DRAFT_318310 [Paraphoma chrysanthemicola]
MALRQIYTLGDYVKFAQTNFHVEYTSIADLDLYRFENLTCVNENQAPREANLLHIGKYHFSAEGAPAAWAHVTSAGITYYTNKPGHVCYRIPTQSMSRIYYGRPFDLMFPAEGSQRTSRDSDPTQTIKAVVIESIINFAYLITGRLPYIRNVKGRDILEDFKFACLSFYRANGLSIKAEHTPLEQFLVDKEANSVRTAKHKSRRVPKKTRVRTKSESTRIVPAKRARFDEIIVDVEPEFGPSYVRTYTRDYLSNSEASVHVQQVQEIDTLRAKVAAKELKIQSTRSKLADEKEKRRALKVALKQESVERRAVEAQLEQLEDARAKQTALQTALDQERTDRRAAEVQLEDIRSKRLAIELVLEHEKAERCVVETKLKANELDLAHCRTKLEDQWAKINEMQSAQAQAKSEAMAYKARYEGLKTYGREGDRRLAIAAFSGIGRQQMR